MNIPAWLKSSHDPAKISLTIKAIGATVVAAIPLIAVFGVKLQADNVVELADQGAVLITSGIAVYGLLRKMWANKSNPQ